MRRDRRRAKLRFNLMERLFYLHYKGKKIPLALGSDDNALVFRYGDDFFVLESNERLGYVGFELISTDLELIQDMFIQNVEEFSEDTGLKKHLFDYSTSFQGDILSQWIQ